MTVNHYIRMTRDQLMEWAADNYSVKQNAEGSPEEALMAGWVNAMDEQDNRGHPLSEEEFVYLAYSEFENMGYHKD